MFQRILGKHIVGLVTLFLLVIMTAKAEERGASISQPQDYTVELGGGIVLEMVWISGGSFEMGSPESEEGRSADEGPVRTVELDGFWIGKFEITQEQFELIMGTNPSRFREEKNPVERVTWQSAMNFCDKLSQLTGDTYTLPTEAQWEYSCRAGSTTAYFFGDDSELLDEYAWYYGNSGRFLISFRKPHPVGQKKPNAWGLYDMHGNVSEWCLDWYIDKYYEQSTEKNPAGPETGQTRVLRGGSWYDYSQKTRSATRDHINPNSSYFRSGFRVVRIPN